MYYVFYSGCLFLRTDGIFFLQQVQLHSGARDAATTAVFLRGGKLVGIGTSRGAIKAVDSFSGNCVFQVPAIESGWEVRQMTELSKTSVIATYQKETDVNHFVYDIAEVRYTDQMNFRRKRKHMEGKEPNIAVDSRCINLLSSLERNLQTPRLFNPLLEDALVQGWSASISLPCVQL